MRPDLLADVKAMIALALDERASPTERTGAARAACRWLARVGATLSAPGVEPVTVDHVGPVLPPKRSTFSPAKYAGFCADCGRRYAVGAIVAWSFRRGGSHARCLPSPEPDPS